MTLRASQFVCIKKKPHQMSWLESYNNVLCLVDPTGCVNLYFGMELVGKPQV